MSELLCYTKYFRITFLVFALVGTSCEQVEPTIQPSKRIIGKWEQTEMGNYPDLFAIEKANGYEEYLPNGEVRFFDYEQSAYIMTGNYWISDSILSIEYQYPVGVTLLFQYKFYFIDQYDANGGLRLEHHQSAAIFSTSIYRKLDE